MGAAINNDRFSSRYGLQEWDKLGVPDVADGLPHGRQNGDAHHHDEHKDQAIFDKTLSGPPGEKESLPPSHCAQRRRG